MSVTAGVAACVGWQTRSVRDAGAAGRLSHGSGAGVPPSEAGRDEDPR